MLPRTALALLLLLVSAAPAQNVSLPATAPAQRLEKFFAAFNSGRDGKIRKFLAENYTPAALSERDIDSRSATYRQLYEQTHGFELRAIAESQPSQVSAVAQAKLAGDWWLITLTVDPAAENRIPGVIFRATNRPPEFTPHVQLSPAQIAAALGQYVDRLSNSGRFAGVVLLAAPDGSTLLRKAAGNTNEGEAVKLSTPFGLASITKVFTAVAIAQLAEKGKLSFDDPLSRFLPQYPKPAGDQITVRELLTHTAGLPPYMGAQYFDKSHTLREHIDAIGSMPLAAPPGTRFVYSNAGYMLLRAVVVASAGETFENYLEEHIFKPAGMKPAGEALMTASDLLRFVDALRAGKLLSPEMRAIVTAGKVPMDEPGVRYGFGFQERTVNGDRLVGHGGGSAYVSARFDMYDNGYTVVVMSDQPNAPSGQIAMRAADLITQK